MKQLHFFTRIFFLLLSGMAPAVCQDLGPIGEVEVRLDTQLIRWSSHRMLLQDRYVLPLPCRNKQQVLELTLDVAKLDPDAELDWIRSGELQVLDSLDYVSDSQMRMKVRITDVAASDQIALLFRHSTKEGKESKYLLHLYPYLKPKVQWRVSEEELFIGEEKAFELNGQFLDQVEATNTWQTGPGYEYRLRQVDDRLRLFVLPLQLGSLDIRIPIRGRKVLPGTGSAWSAQMETLGKKFQVRSGRLAFLSLVDKTELVAEEGIGQAIEIQIDRARHLPVHKTYRVETQQEPGGQLVAEIFTRNLLANDRMLCWLRPYGYHRLSEGYLYIKDGDEPKFISNFNLIEKAAISRVSLLHEGGDWTDNLSVFPGEKVDIRVEGKGLGRSRINLEGIDEWVRDSTVSNDQIVVYHARIPVDFNKRKIALLMNKKPGGFELSVREYQSARNLDFVSIDFGNGYKPITQFNKPILYPHTLQNVVLRFNADQIETMGRLYGKQYLTVDINLYNNRKELVEYKRLENVVVCPGENSVRFPYYDPRDCQSADVSLNNQMIRKTQDLPDWGRIEVVVKTNGTRYNTLGFSHKVEIIQQRKYSFDIDVSFPAGLIIKKVGVPGLGNLSGISTAIVGQLGFYRPDKVEKFYPFKVGAGFIALNAFNFSENSDRDVGLVALASVFPTKMNARFSFPLYLGFGYLLKDSRWFYIMGPGIQVRF